jgi:uncharacterized protein YaeQ
VALSSTIYSFDIDLADADRGVYETLALRLALHPSETTAHLLTRLLAYCLEYEEGIAFSKGGVSEGDEPAVAIKDPSGRFLAWIEAGIPEAARLHRASKTAGRVAVYVPDDPTRALRRLAGQTVHRAAEIPFYALDPALIAALTETLDRRMKLSVSISGRQIYLTVAGRSLDGAIVEHRLAGT